MVRYHATNDNVKYNYCVAPAVAHVHSGDIIEANTLDCFGDAIQHPGDTLAMAKGDNPLTGPFYIDGAEPGDTLAIRFLSLEVNGKQGIGALAPGFGALNPTDFTPMINQPLLERIWFVHRSGGEYRDVQGGRFEFHHENSVASVSRLHWRRARGRRIAQFGRSRGFWRQYGRARGERWKHALLARERCWRAALFLAMGTPPWATAKWRVRRLKFRCACAWKCA